MKNDELIVITLMKLLDQKLPFEITLNKIPSVDSDISVSHYAEIYNSLDNDEVEEQRNTEYGIDIETEILSTMIKYIVESVSNKVNEVRESVQQKDATVEVERVYLEPDGQREKLIVEYTIHFGATSNE